MAKVIIDAIFAHLLPLLEEEFVKHEPEMQAKMLYEMKALSFKLDDWAKSKLTSQGH